MTNLIHPNLLAKEVVEAIQSVIGSGSTPLHEPTFNGNEYQYLKDCIDSGFVSSVGKFVDRFEIELAAYTGANYAVAVVNGTAALHVALIVAGVKERDEVMVPALTFAATANAIRYCNATPHFVDSEERTMGIDAHKLRAYLVKNTKEYDGQCLNKNTGQVIRAIIPMHTFGHPVKLEELLEIAKDFKITLIEDAAESLGSFYKGRHTGTFGTLGTLSFNGNKTITTGGGGAIITNNEALAKYAKHLTTTAKIPHIWEYEHDGIGYNYRMPNINAALGCAQLEQLPQLLKQKRKLFNQYKKAFLPITQVTLFEEPPNCKSNYWLQTIALNTADILQRDSILNATNKINIMTRPVWKLLSELSHFTDCPKMDLSCAMSLSMRIINIPSSANLIKLV